MSYFERGFPRWLSALLVIVCAAAVLYLTGYVWRRIPMPTKGLTKNEMTNKGDFVHFYAAAKAMRQGENIYLSQAPESDRPGYIYPPLIAFLYSPLAAYPIDTAARISLLFNVAAVCGAVGFASATMQRRWGNDMRWQVVMAGVLLVTILSWDKIKGDLQMLQTNSLIACCVAGALWAVDRRPWLAGFFLGFAINVKYHAVAFILYLLLRRRWKAAAAGILFTAFWAYLPATSVGWATATSYLVEGFSGVLRVLGFHVETVAANFEPLSGGFNISLAGFFARWLEAHQGTTNPLLPVAIVGIVWLVLLAALYRLAGVPWLGRAADEAAERAKTAVDWVVIVATTLAISPQTNSRHFVITVIINALGVALVANVKGRPRWLAVAGMVALWAGLNLPPGNRMGSTHTAQANWLWMAGPSWATLLGTGLIVTGALLSPQLWRKLPQPAQNPARDDANATPSSPATLAHG